MTKILGIDFFWGLQPPHQQSEAPAVRVAPSTDEIDNPVFDAIVREHFGDLPSTLSRPAAIRINRPQPATPLPPKRPASQIALVPGSLVHRTERSKVSQSHARQTQASGSQWGNDVSVDSPVQFQVTRLPGQTLESEYVDFPVVGTLDDGWITSFGSPKGCPMPDGSFDFANSWGINSYTPFSTTETALCHILRGTVDTSMGLFFGTIFGPVGGMVGGLGFSLMPLYDCRGPQLDPCYFPQ